MSLRRPPPWMWDRRLAVHQQLGLVRATSKKYGAPLGVVINSMICGALRHSPFTAKP